MKSSVCFVLFCATVNHEVFGTFCAVVCNLRITCMCVCVCVCVCVIIMLCCWHYPELCFFGSPPIKSLHLVMLLYSCLIFVLLQCLLAYKIFLLCEFAVYPWIIFSVSIDVMDRA